MLRELTVDELAWRCPQEWFTWQTSKEVKPAATIVGQDRAVEAIAFGLEMRGIGYNIFVTGLSGTGRLTTIKSFIDMLRDDATCSDDVCFVFNFRKPEEPAVMSLAAGAGRRFRDGMETMVRDLAEDLPKIIKDQEFRRQAESAVEDLHTKEREMVENFDDEVRKAGFRMVQIQVGTMTRPGIVPLVGDKPVPMEQLADLVEKGEIEADDAKRLEETHERFSVRLQEVFQAVADIRREVQERVIKVRREVIQPVLDLAIERLREEVGDERVEEYLSALAEDIQDNIELFADEEKPEADRFLRWQINLAVDNGDGKGRPVVIETEPTYSNVFGTIERILKPSGETTTNFMRIRAGSLLRANGGYLVLNADDLLMEARVWPGLKRALKYRRVQIQTLESIVLGAALLKPAPVPLDVKVVVIGGRNIYDLLYRWDPDFSKVFKVLADFDSYMPSSQNAAVDVISVLRKVCIEEELPHLDRSGMAAMIEEAVRVANWRRRISSRFSDLADLLREAAFQTRRAGKELVTREHVVAARLAHRRRHGLSEDRSHELITEGVLRVETSGRVVGQINGLAVYDLGHHRFGRPSRITARVGLGREGVINIERRAGLSGPSHDKGVGILTGFLRGTFARRIPLNMACSITFEQSYGGIDGDSASSTEIYAIISALSGVPLRQDLAVTGSVDQHGQIQVIGGVNEKVQGFFRVCADTELTGNQGVLIPSANVGDLHLSDEVIKAVDEGKFHIWAVDTIEEGIELLTGEVAGTWSDEEDEWDHGTIYAICQQRLEEHARLIRQAGKDPDKAKDDERDDEEENGTEEKSEREDDRPPEEESTGE